MEINENSYKLWINSQNKASIEKKYLNKMFIKLYFTYYNQISTKMAQTHKIFFRRDGFSN